MGVLARLHQGFGLGSVQLGGFHRGGEFIEIAEAAGSFRKLLLFALDAGDFLIESRQAVAMRPHIGLELPALGGEIGQRRRQLGEHGFGLGQRRFRFGNAVVDATARLDARPDLFLQLDVLDLKPAQRRLGIDALLLLAGDVGRELVQPAIEFGDTFLGTLFLAVEHLARVVEPLQTGCSTRLVVAQCWQF